MNAKQQLGELVKAHREERGLSQEEIAKAIVGTNRSHIAHLEQGLRLPRPDLLVQICEFLGIPRRFWRSFTDPDSQSRLEFEEVLSELTGVSVSIDGHDSPTVSVADEHVKSLLTTNHSEQQTQDLFNSVLVFYGINPTSSAFFRRYLGAGSFASIAEFARAVKIYQKDAVRLFSTLEEAYEQLSQAKELNVLLAPIQPRSVDHLTNRSDWLLAHDITDERLPDLGYISAARVRRDASERQSLSNFLHQLAQQIKQSGASVVSSVPEKTKRRMDSLLRKFNSHFQHGLFSPLFAPDADEVEQEAQRLAPKSDSELARMEETQRHALENLACYLASDFIDVYVATSMRSDADFVSVNHFVRNLFAHDLVRPLRLRYFNPTQSWIDDRIAKGLVEALMLRRASIAIYMAQKSDTFGKDSEASVALGQGKPVIVYVPRLTLPDGTFDSESAFSKDRAELISMLDLQDREEIDESVDKEAILGKVLTRRLEQLSGEQLVELTRLHWADFDLREEAQRVTEERRKEYRDWIEKCISKTAVGPPDSIKGSVISIFVSNAITFESRARVFREIHPLALQVILSSGVLNGILVVRTVEQCAEILSRLIRNDLQLELHKDDQNYRLIEGVTSSTVRVISRHTLLLNAFKAYYGTLR